MLVNIWFCPRNPEFENLQYDLQQKERRRKRYGDTAQSEVKACHLKNFNFFTSLLIMQWDTIFAELRSEAERWILEVGTDRVKLLKLNPYHIYN